jgi:hypothetical protein
MTTISQIVIAVDCAEAVQLGTTLGAIAGCGDEGV